jgi:hypothetical protein
MKYRFPRWAGLGGLITVITVDVLTDFRYFLFSTWLAVLVILALTGIDKVVRHFANRS